MTGTMNIMDRAGDTKVIWDAASADEVATARRTFDDLRAKGYLAYRVKKGGEKGEAIRKFDPEAERIILSPAMAGG